MTARETAHQLEAAVAAALHARETCDPSDRDEVARLDRHLLDAQNALAAQFKPLSHKVAGALMRYYPLVDREELADECMIGIVKASRCWRPGRGNSFQTHAWNGAFRVGRSWGGKANAAGFRGLSQRPTFRPGVIDTVEHDGELRPAVDGLAAPEPDPPDDRLADLPGLLARLADARLRAVIRMRFHEGLTLLAVGERLGLTRERIRQLEAKAIRELRVLAGVGDDTGGRDG
jgi:DNA-directed RNA polymerase specialized sigma24 family protein